MAKEQNKGKKNFDQFDLDDVTENVKTEQDEIRDAANAVKKETPTFDMTGGAGTAVDALNRLENAEHEQIDDKENKEPETKLTEGLTDEQVKDYKKTSEEIAAMTDEEKKAHNKIMARKAKLRKTGILKEVEVFGVSDAELEMLQQVSRASRIVGYVMANDQRVDISTSTKVTEGNVVQVAYKAVNRAPSGRQVTLVKMPKAAYERLSLGVALDTSTAFTEAQLKDLGLYAIPESKLVDQLGAFFGAEIYEDEAITEKYVTRGKNPVPHNSPDKMTLRNGQVKQKDDSTIWKLRTMFQKRRLAVNTINYIPNRRMDLTPVVGLTAEQAKDLNMAAFYRELMRQAGTNPNYVDSKGRTRVMANNNTGARLEGDNTVTSAVFVAGAGSVPEFFSQVPHWYNRADNGEEIYLTPEQILVPNRKTIVDGEGKIKISVADKRLDSSDETKTWDFDLATDFPFIAQAIADVPGAAIDKDFVVKALSANRKGGAGGSRSTSTDPQVSLALLRAKRQDKKFLNVGFEK